MNPQITFIILMGLTPILTHITIKLYIKHLHLKHYTID